MTLPRKSAPAHPPARFRTRPVWAALLGAAALLAGCRSQTPPAPGLSPTDTATVAVPPVAPLFAAITTTLPQAVVAHAPVAAPPPSTEQASQLAAAASDPPPPPPPGGPARCGLVVCEPVADAPLASFGAGCGRWLHLYAAGQPALGATPLWNSLARAEQELGRTDLRLASPQAAALAGALGVTHVATGRLVGTAARCTLTYRLWRVPQLVPLGPPLTLAGSQAQVVAGLPGLARALDARLGVVHPSIPASAALTPAELDTLGGMALYPDPTDAQLGALAALAVRSPLAGVALLDTPAVNDQGVLDRTVAALLRRAPGNALVVAQIADTAAPSLRPHAATVQALIRQYPQSYLLSRADGLTQAVWGTRTGQWQAAQRCVADAPASPAAWQGRALVLGDMGQDLRQGRTAEKITPQEWATLNSIYSKWEAAALHATRLDPRYGAAWAQLAQAATFAGDDAQARSALWTALKLAPNSYEVLDWGLEMFQPKWLGDQGALDQVAQATSAARFGSAGTASRTANELRTAGYPVQADAILARYLAQARAAVSLRPGSGMARWELGAILYDLGDVPSLGESLREYQAAVGLLPNSPSLRDAFGDVLDKRGRLPAAVVQYRQAIALDPFYARAYYDLGWDLKEQGQYAAAKQAMSRSLHLDPSNGDVYNALGRVLSIQQQWPAAVSMLTVAGRLTPYNVEVFDLLCNDLDHMGQYAASLTAGRQAVNLNPADGNARDEMADDYLHTKSWDASIAMSEAALKINPNDALAHENLGEAYIGQGRKEEAHAEWQTVLTLDNGPLAQVARGMLARYP